MSRRHHKARKPQFRRRTPPGSSPGVWVVDPAAPRPTVRVMAYGNGQFVEEEIRDLSRIGQYLHHHPVTWVDVDGLGDAEILKRIGSLFGLHPLAMEDVVHVHQRPKVEEYGEHLFIVAVMAERAAALRMEQFSLFCGRDFVLTFQERPGGDSFEPVRNRLRAGRGQIHASGSDYLTYALLDAVVDAYFPVLEHYGERLENMEELVLSTPHREIIQRIHDIKHDLLLLRRVAWPTREALNALIRDPFPEIGQSTRVYLRDCYDHTVQIIDLLELYRELSSDLMSLYLSNVSHRMNEVMRVLTVISTLFMPLTFIVGIYGMNFDPDSSPWNMPEVRWYWGYPLVWAAMVLTTLWMLGYFHRRGWLGAHPALPEDAVDGER